MAGRTPSLASCIAELACEVEAIVFDHAKRERQMQAIAAERTKDELRLLRITRELAALAEQTRPQRMAAAS